MTRHRAPLFALLSGALLVACTATPDDTAHEPPSRVVLITVDTLRADHLGAYGYPRDVTPFVDQLAETGVLFNNTYAVSSTTLTCHASLFSSLYPPQHQLIRNGETLHESVYTMAQMFQAQGYRTGAFSTVGFLQTLERGFDVFSTEKKYFPSQHVVGKAMQWLRENKDAEKIFVWIHLFDVHEWYRPKHLHEDAKGAATERTKIDREALVAYLEKRHGVLREHYKNDDDALLDAINRYDDQLTVVDGEIRRLYGAFTDEGIDRGDTLWIVTTDHGEGLGSHDFKGHGAKIYNEQIRVPMIWHFTDGRHAGAQVDQLVRHVDVLPTLAEMLKTTPDKQVFAVAGRSFLPLVEGRRDNTAMRYAYAQRRDADEQRLRGGWEPGDVFSLTTLDYKYIYKSERADEFYDLRQDPTESVNLIDEPSDVKDRMRGAVIQLHATMSEEGSQLGRSEINPKHIEELKALGYIDVD